MGISRLSQDLSPYADHVVLGTSPQTPLPPEATIIKDLIVDGPSLVYWVYNRLVAYQRLNSPTSAALPPTYLEINNTLHHMLNDFQAHGVNIQHIFFDGGLPASKRKVRFERMEKLRQQLETYRKLYPEFPPVAALPGPLDLEKMLWDTPVLSTRRSILPAPPFMVASAIESLSTSDWKDRVHVVPGEADAFCALAAQQSVPVVAVLTNDSDLSVHDLGPNGRVVLLHSLENKQRRPHKESYISALSLDPKLVANRMKVSSLLGFGFERFLDSGASFAIIQQRARDSSRLERLQDEYRVFAEPFIPTPPLSMHPFSRLENIDPRTAEIVSNLEDPPHIYLTPLLEDPQRDSSWSYGAKIRQLAYSLLLMTSPSIAMRKSSHVVESARKGQRIISVSVACLQHSEITEQAAELLQLLEAYISGPNCSPTVPDGSMLLEWYSLAVYLIQQEKFRLGKPPPTLQQILRLLGLGSTPQIPHRAPMRVTWDDIHLLSNIHAVLYSIRILSQITEYLVNPPEEFPARTTISELAQCDDISRLTNNIRLKLSALPPIEKLFLDIPNLRAQLSKQDLEKQSSEITLFNRLLNPSSGDDQMDEHDTSDAAQGRDFKDEYWTTTTSKKKRKRKSEWQGNPETITERRRNGFDLLPEEPG
ncbi:uncharacterized protein Z520_08677 [Fonsecaea multimorphosa CBS 102226]|uniref:Asteroid domain-containing protein n=1 Tax=Fonsecaea multimorphosa CBS 102226 TaxID=1442371 RepID=A0A0D2JQC7_9EURO|nr:uncharacterized protein Z520_08677 [Fonsecaea multimorphosa CBS 102226]KIX95557.1 hypothetical protein Z520_08677 [Fonsecaea multimorphosa CBS 102226]OAL21403.1 hypothetical protein AYO22_08126 [Fonsecaea multimorphosa]